MVNLLMDYFPALTMVPSTMALTRTRLPPLCGSWHPARRAVALDKGSKAQLLQRNHNARQRLSPAHACLKRDIACAEARRNC